MNDSDATAVIEHCERETFSFGRTLSACLTPETIRDADRDYCGTLHANLKALRKLIDRQIERLERIHGFSD